MVEFASPDHPHFGGFENDRGFGTVVWDDDPVNPPFSWTTEEKVRAFEAGVSFCWWCGESEVLIGALRFVRLDGAAHGVNLRGCGSHIDNVIRLLDADEEETDRLIYGGEDG